MSSTDWIISTGAAAIATLIALVSYFAQKWFETIDEKLKEHSSDLKDLSKQVSTLESKQSSQAKNISQAIHTQLSAVQFPHGKIDQIEQEVRSVRAVVSEKLLPQSEQLVENYGKIVVLEGSVREQNEKLVKMFQVLKIIAEKSQKEVLTPKSPSGKG